MSKAATLNEYYADAFAELERSPKPKPITADRAQRALVIAITPRSGSTMLSSLLEQTGVLGTPDEYLNRNGPMQLHGRKLQRYDFESYWDAVLRKQRTPNGVFAIKTDYDQLRPLIERGVVESYLPNARYVYLRREDVVAQAVSLQRAISSGIWHLDRDGKPLRSRQHAEPVYDGAAIRHHIDHLNLMQANWDAFFRERYIAPLRLTYERLVAGPASAVRSCLALCGEKAEVVGPLSAKTSKVADDSSEAWCRRYREEQAAAGATS